VIHPDLIQQGRVTEHCRATHRENGDNSASIAYSEVARHGDEDG
jgi:hypothetical protein